MGLILLDFVRNENPDAHGDEGDDQDPSQKIRADEARECGAERARNGVIEKGCGKDAENNRQRLSEARGENDGKEHRFVADFRGNDNARGEQ